MKAFISKIGLIDSNDKEHFVEFFPGINVVTGKSSTGKSALFSIFNYCFGSSKYIIPQGVIASNAALFYVVFKFEHYFLLLARRPDEQKAMIQQVKELKSPFCLGDFDLNLFFPLEDFKKSLAKFFGLKIDDIEEDTEALLFRKRKGAPSVRLFLPYLAQTQNIMTSYSQLFYGFEEPYVKQQTIEQFSIVSGFVDQTYFFERQKLNKLKKEVKTLVGKRRFAEERLKECRLRLNQLLYDYKALTGISVDIENVKEILDGKEKFLQRLEDAVDPEQSSSQFVAEELNKIDKSINLVNASLRDLGQKLNEIEVTESISKGIHESFKASSVSDKSTIVYTSQCPFCLSRTENLNNEANKLADAISWLNEQLTSVPALEESFEIEKNKLNNLIEEKRDLLKELRSKRRAILNVSDKLKHNYSLYEQVLKVTYKIEIVLEEMSSHPEDQDQLIEQKEKDIKELEERINKTYKVEEKLENASSYINNQINLLANKLGFEKSYKPLNFSFNLKNFKLFTLKEGKRIYLGQMGSAANWLYCHLSLLMAFTRYFASLKDSALIPPILFLDQPSQAYFPALDNNNEFAGTISHEDGERKENTREENIFSPESDLGEVCNFFDQLVLFNKETLTLTGYEPQIIITEHADQLKLTSCDFESLVRARWRAPNSGLINFSSFLGEKSESNSGVATEDVNEGDERLPFELV